MGERTAAQVSAAALVTRAAPWAALLDVARNDWQARAPATPPRASTDRVPFGLRQRAASAAQAGGGGGVRVSSTRGLDQPYPESGPKHHFRAYGLEFDEAAFRPPAARRGGGRKCLRILCAVATAP
jgi:hypothetical protein